MAGNSFRTSLLTAVLAVSVGVFAQEAPPTVDDWGAFDEMGDWDDEDVASPFSWAGFIDIAAGTRLQSNSAIRGDTTLTDIRGQFQADYAFDSSKIGFRGDVWYDGVTDSWESQIRELYWQGNLGFLGKAGEKFDLKAGQQILTWGVGDYLFLNDLFPKDYQSFFAGRDDDYLKYPSLAVKLSGYFDFVNVDFVVMPEFEPDNGINGEYFSYFNPMLAENTGARMVIPDENKPDDPEYAMRLYRSVAGTELAIYGYKGFTKLPEAADELGRPLYSDLTVTGFSAIRPVGPGIGKLEYAFHDGDDTDGSNPLIPNDQTRFLIGYEQELVANLTAGVQWYTEFNHDFDVRIANSSWPQFEATERRHVFTTQLRYQALQQTLVLHAFNFWSPTDDDGFLRFRATYSPTDKWQVSGGMNLFYGDEAHTFYGQFEDASNVYASFRYFFEG
mgnify:CR=1 FL=1